MGSKHHPNYSQHLDLVNLQSPHDYTRYDKTVKTWDDDPVAPMDLPILLGPGRA